MNARGGVGLWMIKLGDALSKYEAACGASSKASATFAEEPTNVGNEIAVSFLREWAISASSTDGLRSKELDLSSENFLTALDSALVRKLTVESGKVKEAVEVKKKGGPMEGFKASQAARNGGAASMEQNPVANLACRIIGVCHD